jgi:hypothetical protein
MESASLTAGVFRPSALRRCLRWDLLARFTAPPVPLAHAAEMPIRHCRVERFR